MLYWFSSFYCSPLVWLAILHGLSFYFILGFPSLSPWSLFDSRVSPPSSGIGMTVGLVAYLPPRLPDWWLDSVMCCFIWRFIGFGYVLYFDFYSLSSLVIDSFGSYCPLGYPSRLSLIAPFRSLSFIDLLSRGFPIRFLVHLVRLLTWVSCCFLGQFLRVALCDIMLIDLLYYIPCCLRYDWLLCARLLSFITFDRFSLFLIAYSFTILILCAYFYWVIFTLFGLPLFLLIFSSYSLLGLPSLSHSGWLLILIFHLVNIPCPFGSISLLAFLLWSFCIWLEFLLLSFPLAYVWSFVSSWLDCPLILIIDCDLIFDWRSRFLDSFLIAFSLHYSLIIWISY